MIPFIFCSFFGVLLSFICYWVLHVKPDLKLFFGVFGQIIVYGAPWWNIPVWFLSTLFLVKVITSQYEGKHTAFYLLTTVAVFVTHHILSHSDRFNYIGNTALATFVYILGYKLKDVNFKRYMMYWIIGISYMTIFIIFPTALDIWSNKSLFGSYYLAVLSAILGIILVNKIFYLCKFLHIKPLIFMGQNAMLFLAFHVPFYLLFFETFRNSGMTTVELNWGGAAFSIMGCFCVYLFFEHNKNLKWLIGG